MSDTPAPEISPIALRVATNAILDRMRFANMAGMTFGGKRNMWETLGYNDILTSTDYRARYARGGIAGRVVDALPKATWRGGGQLVEDEDPKTDTKFEQQWKSLDTRLKVWPRLQRVDILASLSSYAVLLIGDSVSDDLSKELARGDGTPDKINYLTPFQGGVGPQYGQKMNRNQRPVDDADAKILEFDLDVRSPRFGLPKFYQLRRVDADAPNFTQPVHWSRIIHIAQDVLDDDVYGAPALERVWNLLDDLDKVTGGGAEAFWLRANQGLNINIDKDHNIGEVGSAERTALQQEVEKYVNRIDRVLKTQGATVETLGSDVANFLSPADAILTQIAGAKAIPKRILTGSEMGELASSQDRENWRDQVTGRREGFADPFMVRLLADRLIEYNYLIKPAKPYKVEFATITTMTEAEKYQGAKAWSQTTNNGLPVFTTDEIRDQWYGKEPLTPEQLAKMKAEKPEPPPSQFGQRPAADDKTSAGKFPRAAMAGPHTYSNTQIQLEPYIGVAEFGRMIPNEDLHDKGRETDEHITVKYGLHTSNPDDVARVVQNFEGPIRATLGKTSYFEGEDYDVVMVKVKSSDLHRLNAMIANNTKVTDTFPNYVPHATIAYVKKGLGPKYAGHDFFNGTEVEVNELTFSNKEGERTIIPITAREHSPLMDASEEFAAQQLAAVLSQPANKPGFMAFLKGLVK